MKIKEYQKLVNEMPLYDDPALALSGEVGELQEHIKKDRRPGDRRQPADIEKITLEAGDVLWYLTRSCSMYGISMKDVMEKNIEKLNKRHK